jgi:proline dehydrogenase
MMMESVDIASAQPGNFIAAKITAFVPPGILLRWTNTLLLLREKVRELSDQDSQLNLEQFSKLGLSFPLLKDHMERLFTQLDKNKDGKVDWIDISAEFSLLNSSISKLMLKDDVKAAADHEALITKQDLEISDSVLKELTLLCEYAREKRVRIMMDAEQTYFQAAIDDISLGLCQRFNERIDSSGTEPRMKYALIYNTTQLYLKDGYERLVLDVERAK